MLQHCICLLCDTARLQPHASRPLLPEAALLQRTWCRLELGGSPGAAASPQWSYCADVSIGISCTCSWDQACCTRASCHIDSITCLQLDGMAPDMAMHVVQQWATSPSACQGCFKSNVSLD
jgi:hypothetical protein